MNHRPKLADKIWNRSIQIMFIGVSEKEVGTNYDGDMIISEAGYNELNLN